MALITCPDCASEISGTAAACPQCGREFAEKMDWTTASLVGAVFLLVTQLVCVDELSTALEVSLYSATVALPLLMATYGARAYSHHVRQRHAALHALFLILTFAGGAAALVSVAAMFFHFSSRAGWLFSALAAATLLFNRLYIHLGTPPERRDRLQTPHFPGRDQAASRDRAPVPGYNE